MQPAKLAARIVGLMDPAESAPRSDWGGMSALLEMYEESSGDDRDNFIEALALIIRRASARPEIIAQLVHFATSLDLSQIEPAVRELQNEMNEVGGDEALQQAITNYLAHRSLARTQKANAGVIKSWVI